MTLSSIPVPRTLSSASVQPRFTYPRPTVQATLLVMVLTGACVLTVVQAAWPLTLVVLVGLVRQLVVMSRPNVARRS